ncbi:MAG: hypothetical protein R3C44_04140 [Chloroflexota bacterium]
MYGRKVAIDLAQDASVYAALLADQPFVKAVETQNRRVILTVDDPETSNPAIVRAGSCREQMISR